MPAAVAPAMSVSRRSPTTSGRPARYRRAVCSSSATPGLPATTSGSRPTTRLSSATKEPFPGAMPREVGTVRSVLAATHGIPRSSAYAPSASIRQSSSGVQPCTTACGSSRADVTGVRPCASRASVRPRPPTTRTGDATGSMARRQAAAACALVTMSSVPASIPILFSARATCSGVRAALFVTNAVRMRVVVRPREHLGCSGDGVAADVHRAVEVDDGQVVGVAQRDRGRRQDPRDVHRGAALRRRVGWAGPAHPPHQAVTALTVRCRT